MMRLIFILLFPLFILSNGYAQEAVLAPKDASAVLADLEKQMAGVKTVSTNFIQEKEMAVFKQKLILEGRILLKKPDLLAWHVNKPLRYSMIMNGNMVKQWDEDTNKIQQLDISKSVSFQAAIVQMKSWFSGSYVSMQKDYNIRVISDAPVVLEFIPKPDSMAVNFIEKVTVSFQKDRKYIDRIFIEEKNKDKTLLVFTNTNINMPIDSKDWQVSPHVQ